MKIFLGVLGAIIAIVLAFQMLPEDDVNDTKTPGETTSVEDGMVEAQEEVSDADQLGSAEFEAPTLEIEAVPNSDSQVMAVGSTRPYSTVRIFKDAACTNSNGAGKADDHGNYRIPVALAADSKWEYWVKAKLGVDESPCSSEPVEFTPPS